MKNDNRIEIRVPSELKEDLQKQAETKGVLLTEHLTGILNEAGSNFVRCPKCNAPAFNKNLVPITGKAKIKCKCGNVWVNVF